MSNNAKNDTDAHRHLKTLEPIYRSAFGMEDQRTKLLEMGIAGSPTLATAVWNELEAMRATNVATKHESARAAIVDQAAKSKIYRCTVLRAEHAPGEGNSNLANTRDFKPRVSVEWRAEPTREAYAVFPDGADGGAGPSTLYGLIGVWHQHFKEHADRITRAASILETSDKIRIDL